jgi:8-oxo-dGTP pyrophosphatase MutT (NUDIX family)
MAETDVAQLVIRTEIQDVYRYFLARRTRDGYWEWIGGKREEDETIEETAERELKEEIQIDWESHGFEIQGVADSYSSEADSSYLLNPVLIEVGEEAFRAISEEHLSREHDSFEWIDLTGFGDFETLGQYKALERLDLIEGDVALAVLENEGEYLIVERSEENTSSGKWGFVSGKMENDENPEETAKRELWEETRLEAEPLETGEFYIGKGELGYWRLFPVLMETGSREVELNWELSDYRWISLEEINEQETIGRLKALEKLSIDYE